VTARLQGKAAFITGGGAVINLSSVAVSFSIKNAAVYTSLKGAIDALTRQQAVVTQGFQRTRWSDGRAWVWLGVRKQTGRGEGSSGLAFDRLVDVPPQA
jgi:hypothetical protein